MRTILLAAEGSSYGLLEWTFLGVLLLMTLAIGGLATMVIARVVEPKGVRVLVRRLLGKA